MTERELLDRITANPKIYSGKPIIRGHRLAVSHVLEMMSAGSTPEELLASYDWLEREDIEACLLYAARTVDCERVIPLVFTD